MNQNQQPTDQDDAVRSNGQATSGGGVSDSRLDATAEIIMRAMAAHGVTRAPHTEALASRIAAYPHVLEVIETEQSAIRGKSRNEPGALYSRLNRMTADDWAAREPKAGPRFRIKEPSE